MDQAKQKSLKTEKKAANLKKLTVLLPVKLIDNLKTVGFKQKKTLQVLCAEVLLLGLEEVKKPKPEVKNENQN
ncbi:MAG: hypothetical protein PHR06_09265 [Candidatus Cloacimonetes bacterium]|nr:hypothetical protein [Candidatus Cloacimonadota bacterium]